jgi:cell division protein FtsI/penicillin-binding protein 2
LQSAAEHAMSGETRKSSLAAVRIDTGEILAVVNTPATGHNTAFPGSTQPGSTLKIVTAATLLDKDVVRPEDRVGCPESANAGGMRFTNSEGRAFPNATFRQAFRAVVQHDDGRASGQDHR